MNPAAVRSMKGKYDDQASLAAANFIPEKY